MATVRRAHERALGAQDAGGRPAMSNADIDRWYRDRAWSNGAMGGKLVGAGVPEASSSSTPTAP